MKARIEELAKELFSGDGTMPDIRAALVTLAEECFEKAANVCDGHEDFWIEVAESDETGEASNHYTALAAGAGVCACSVRAMKGGLK